MLSNKSALLHLSGLK